MFETVSPNCTVKQTTSVDIDADGLKKLATVVFILNCTGIAKGDVKAFTDTALLIGAMCLLQSCST